MTLVEIKEQSKKEIRQTIDKWILQNIKLGNRSIELNSHRVYLGEININTIPSSILEDLERDGFKVEKEEMWPQTEDSKYKYLKGYLSKITISWE
jgi:hypothetical protein